MAVSMQASVTAAQSESDRPDHDMSDHGAAAVATQQVHVSLFGALAVHCRERPLRYRNQSPGR